MSGWWNHASTEQRLAQIDGGIEVGMNASQIAFNCGVRRTDSTDAGSLLRSYAKHYGRDFAHIGRGNIGFIARQNLAYKSSALEQGDPFYAIAARDVHKVKKSIDRTHDIPADAFSIFSNEPQDEILSWGEK